MAKRVRKQPVLKPQDLLLVLKLCSDDGSRNLPYAELAQSVGLTASETHAATERAEVADLLRRDLFGRHPIKRNVAEFVIHGAKYAFPAVRGRVTRGMPTSYGAPPLDSQFSHMTEAVPVWPTATGKKRGPSIIPLYRTVPEVALKDARLYELLALFDAIREGRARERELAAKLLRERLE